jgi:hypothetical protein
MIGASSITATGAGGGSVVDLPSGPTVVFVAGLVTYVPGSGTEGGGRASAAAASRTVGAVAEFA